MIDPHNPAILNYLQHLAGPGNPPPSESVFQQFADYFDANGIGVSCSHDALAATTRFFRDAKAKAPEAYPWQTDASLLPRLRSALPAHAHQDGTGEWLLSLAREPRHGAEVVVWAHRPVEKQHGWKDPEVAQWPLVAHTLVRWLSQHSELVPSNVCLRQQLEKMAVATSRLSHDFGNYLTGILGFTELSLGQVQPGSLLHRYLQEVLESARQGSDWIRRLHWFCRRNGGYAWPAEFSSVLDEVQGRLLPGPSPRWEKKIPHDLPLMAIDPPSLQAGLTELANNAREACKGKGTLTFSARAVELVESDCRFLLGTAQAGSYVEISVADDGPGIPSEVRAKLYQEPFFSSKPRHRGLGFLVLYGILYRFHGGLRIEELETGKGAQVRLYVPSIAVESVTQTTQQVPNVLVVHPDPLLYESLRKILEWQGYRVTVAVSAQAALSLYQTPGQSFALVLAEAMLPQLSGFDLARRILERDSRANFMFLYTQASFHGLGEEEMLKKYVLMRWPLETPAFVQAVRAALTKKSSPTETGKSFHGLR